MDFKLRRAGHIVIRCGDVERSRRFFAETVGLKPFGKVRRGMHFLTADFDENHHMVLVRPAREGAEAQDPRRRIGMAAASFEVRSFGELKALYGRLRRDGAEIERTEDRGAVKAVFARDPDGNLFEFYCRDGGAAPALADHTRVRGDLEAELAAPA